PPTRRPGFPPASDARRRNGSGFVAPQLVEHTFQRLDVAELRLDVEEIPLDDAGDPVADAFANDDRPEALGDRILDRVADAARHRHRGDPVRTEKSGQIGAVEGAG